MSVSINQTVCHLKSMMSSVKDVVFPMYSEVRTESALSNIADRLAAVSSREIADAFIGKLPAIRDLIAADVEAVAHNDPAASDPREVVFCYPAVTARL